MSLSSSLPPALPGLPPLLRNAGLLGSVAVVLGVVILPMFVWFGCRVSPDEGQIAVLVRKTGTNPPSGTIIADKGQKGIQLDVLSEGRYFLNPYTWKWSVHPITDIPAGKLGVLTRLYGKDLPPGQILAKPDTKGILPEILSAGKHRINPSAYSVGIFDATAIRPGHIGVKVSLVGADPLSSPDGQRNTFIVAPGTKGVLSETLDPGTYYLNPYLYNVAEVNLQSQRFEMSGDDSIEFLTVDGFAIKVEGTLEYAIKRDKAALLTHEVGELDEVLQKLILPNARGFARTEGSKSPALNYIVGETRQQFQDKLESHLKKVCGDWGVEVRSVLVRNIAPPDASASIVRERELAVQTRGMYGQQIEQAKSKAKLVRQDKLAEQNTEKVQAETIQIQAKILAEQNQQVALTAANQRLSVAKLQKAAAEAQAQAVLAEARGKQTVIKAQNEADAGVLAKQSEAFGGGTEYAKYLFYLKAAPQIQSILTSDGPDGFGSLFNSYLPSQKAAK